MDDRNCKTGINKTTQQKTGINCNRYKEADPFLTHLGTVSFFFNYNSPTK